MCIRDRSYFADDPTIVFCNCNNYIYILYFKFCSDIFIPYALSLIHISLEMRQSYEILNNAPNEFAGGKGIEVAGTCK